MSGRESKVFTPDFSKSDYPEESFRIFKRLIRGGVFVEDKSSNGVYFIGVPTIIGSHTMAVSLSHLRPDDQLDFANADFESPVFMNHSIILGTTPRGHIIFIGDIPPLV